MSISRETKPHKCPTGTIRNWERGMVIKLHDATDFHNGWYNLPDFPVLTALGNKLNAIALQFIRVKNPVDGEKFLDEVITSFQREEGEDAGPFLPKDFKQYEGFYGAARYSFTNEFTKRAMGIWQAMYEEIQNQLGNAQKSKGDKLNDEQIKVIKEAVKAKYKEKLKNEVDISLFEELGAVIQNNYKHLMEAVDLSPELKEKYDTFVSDYLSKINDAKATGYFDVVDLAGQAKQYCVENFSSNWILFQSQLDNIDNSFEKYLKKNSSEISAFIKKESVKRFDIDVFGNAHEFYNNIVNKIQSTSVIEAAPALDELTGEYKIELNGLKGHISLSVEEPKDNTTYSQNNKVTIAANKEIAEQMIGYLNVTNEMKLQQSENDNHGIVVFTMQLPHTDLINRFYKNGDIADNQIQMKQFASLLALVGKYPLPTADSNASFKRYYLTGREINSYYKGQKLDFSVGFKRGTTDKTQHTLYEQPTISFVNHKDAKKIKNVLIKKMLQTGFKKEVAERQFDKYAEMNQYPLDKYDLNIIFTDLQNSGVFQKAKLDFKPVLQMRFNTKYNKSIDGDWNRTNIKALETIENVIDALPKGHIHNNAQLLSFNYDAEYNKDYAFYDPQSKKIQFSPDCLRSTSKQTNLDGSSHFASVVIHEMGHAVSKKVGNYSNQEYRKFANECGWSYKEERTKDHASKNDIRIPRNGSNSGRELITDYSGVSPEEAFAEYYSFYHLNKEHLDKYLDTGDATFLKQHQQRFVTNEKKIEYQPKLFNEMPSANIYLTPDNKLYDMVQKTFVANNFDDELDHNVTSVSPWTIKFEKPFAPEHTRNLLRDYRSSNAGLPVFVIDNNNGTYDSIEGRSAFNQDNIIEANRFAQRNQPIVSISRRAYDKLSEKYPGDVISEMMAKKFQSTPIPTAQKIEKVETQKVGLFYDGNVIDHAIITSNADILQQMRNIYTSDELKKAIDKTFNKSDENQGSANLSAISTFFKPFTDKLGNIVKFAREKKQKKSYADLLIITHDLRLLILQRDKDDDFMPARLALPGGKIEEGEIPLCTVIRETFEETNVVFKDEDLRFIKTVDNGDTTKTFYYYTVLSKEFVLEDHIVLDSSEQRNYQLVSIDKIVNGEIDADLFILDLAARLKTIFEEDEILSTVIEQPQYQLIDVTPEIKIATKYSALSYLMHEFDHCAVQEDLFIQTLIDNKDMLE